MKMKTEDKTLHEKNKTPITDLQTKEDIIIKHIQEFCHANGYYLVKLEISKL
jgi:hypothetical protein